MPVISAQIINPGIILESVIQPSIVDVIDDGVVLLAPKSGSTNGLACNYITSIAIDGWSATDKCITPIEGTDDWAVLYGDADSNIEINIDGEIIQVATNFNNTGLIYKGLTGEDAKVSAINLYQETGVGRSSFCLAVRMVDVDNFIGYRNYDDQHQVYERLAGVWTQLYDVENPISNAGTDGQRIELKVVGTVVTLTVGTTEHIMVLPANLTTGGIGMIGRSANNLPVSLTSGFTGELL